MPSDNENRPVRLVTCPTCKGESIYASTNPFRPFCSERCKNMDFGAWASEGFRVPTETTPEDPGPEAPRLQ